MAHIMLENEINIRFVNTPNFEFDPFLLVSDVKHSLILLVFLRANADTRTHTQINSWFSFCLSFLFVSLACPYFVHNSQKMHENHISNVLYSCFMSTYNPTLFPTLILLHIPSDLFVLIKNKFDAIQSNV